MSFWGLFRWELTDQSYYILKPVQYVLTGEINGGKYILGANNPKLLKLLNVLGIIFKWY